MDEKRAIIRELQKKENADTAKRNRLLAELGEALINNIGAGETLNSDSGESPGAILKEFRAHLNEIDESSETIKSLEEETLKLKTMDAAIAEKEAEHSSFRHELDEVSKILGKQLFPDPEYAEIAGASKEQEEKLLAKIEELEKKLENLNEKEGGFLSWVGKNTQMVMNKSLLLKKRMTLQRLYQSTGEKFLSLEQEKPLSGDAEKTMEKARGLKNHMNSTDKEITALKSERKQLSDLLNAECSPARRISALEKRIAQNKDDLRGVYLRFGTLADKSRAENSQYTEVFSALFTSEDNEVLKRIEQINASIAERDLEIKKLEASIGIENLNKIIKEKKEKISFAEKTISDCREQIEISEDQIKELEEFLHENQ